ncbi:MAG: hypothetical protein LC789_14120 [Actinobacteria bacterium]|nr:hypothetical protein [Actinomycetota bacterium]MCA1722520.1 hypothetical protein [Actinomycetota bacterium]
MLRQRCRVLVVAVAVVATAAVGVPAAFATHPCYQGQPPEECSHPPARQPPPAGPDVLVGNADDGSTVHLTPGQRLVITLRPTRAGDLWQGPDRSTDWLFLSRLAVAESGTTATLDAAGVPTYAQPPTAPERGPMTVTARTDARCTHDPVPCDYTPRTWSITVYIDASDNPAASRYDACTVASATPTAGIALAAYAGGTVAVARGDELSASLPCTATDVTVPRAGPELFRDAASVDPGGYRLGHFVALRTGDTAVTFERDARCAHEQDRTCTAVYSRPLTPTTVGVHVAEADAPCVSDLRTSGSQVPFGRSIAVTGTTAPGAAVGLWFRRGYTDPFTQRRSLVAGADGTFATSYVADADYAVYATAGRCTTPVVRTTVRPTISGPSVVRRGSTVTLTVRAPGPYGSVQIAFRRAGATAFSTRRSGQTDSRGMWTATFVADADYRYYATYTRYFGGGDGYAYTQAEQRRSSLGLTQVR